MRRLRDRMDQDLEIRGYSPRTRKIYVDCVGAFVRHFDRPPAQLGPEEIREYQLHLIEGRGLSYSYFNQAVCALRFFYNVTLGKGWDVGKLPYQKRERRLPEILSHDEVAALIAGMRGLRDRAIVMTLYGCGLRLEEVRHLRVEHIDSDRMVVRVVQGKGKKDRYVRLPDALLETLRLYWRLNSRFAPSRSHAPWASLRPLAARASKPPYLLALGATTPKSAGPDKLGAGQSTIRALAATCQNPASLARRPVRRQDPR